MTLSNLRYHAAFLLIAGFAMTAPSLAQFPQQGPPKHYAWSDTSLSPDARADLVIKEPVSYTHLTLPTN